MLLTLLASLALAASHEAVPSVGLSTEALERENTRAELWQRRILPADAVKWSPLDQALLERIRRAEQRGAVNFLRRRVPLKGLVIDYKPAGGAATLRLTKEGHEKYLFIKTQEAIRYFENREVPAKSIFLLRDRDQNPLFEEGALTEPGEWLVDAAAAGQAAFWLTPDGQTQGNRRRPPVPPTK